MPFDSMNAKYWLVTAIIAMMGVLGLGLWLPASYATGILYIVPILLAVRSSRTRTPGLVIGLISAGLVLLTTLASLFNLTLSVPEIGLPVFHALASWLAIGLACMTVIRIGASDRQLKTERDLRITQLTVDQAVDAVIWHRGDQIVYVNDAACRAHGYTQSELESMTIDVINPYLSPDKRRQLMDRILRNGFAKFETQNQRKDGTSFPVEVSATAHDISGETLVCGVVRDISNRKVIESRLRFTQMAVEQTAEAILCNDSTGRLVYANEAACKKLGYTRSELLSLHVWDIDSEVGINDFDEMFNLIRAVGFRVFESTHQRKKGEQFPVEVRASFVEIENKTYVFGTAHDITVRKNTEKSLAISDDRFRLLAKATNDGIWDWDLVTDEVWWNEEYAIQFGSRRPGTVGSSDWLAERVHPDDLPRLEHSFWAAVAGNASTWTCEYRFRRADGQYRHILDRAYISRDEDGKAVRFLGAMQDLTDRKKVEHDLRHHQDELKQKLNELEQIYKTAPVGLCLLDLDHQILRANDELARQFGKPTGELIGNRVLNCSTALGAWFEKSSHDLNQFGIETTNLPIEVPHPENPDENLHLLVSMYPICDAAGINFAIGGVTQDITSIVRAEQALRESDAELQLITDSVPTLISYIDSDQRYQFNNLAYESFFGIKCDQIKGKTVREINGEQNYAIAGPYIQRALQGERVQFEIDIVRQNSQGERTQMLANFVPRFGKDGTVLGFYVLATDISFLKQAEDELRKSEQRLRLAMKAGRMGTFDWNLVTHKATVSDMVYILHGYEPGEVGPEFAYFTDRIHPDDLPEALEEMHECIDQNKELSREYRVIWPDASVHWIEVRSRTVYDSDQKPVRMFGVVIDIDQKKIVEQKLKEDEAKLHRAARLSALGELTTGMAHELNQPLAAVVNIAEFLNRSAKTNGLETNVLNDTLESLCDSAFRASDIIKRMRSMVRKSTSHHESSSINDLVREGVELIRPQLRMNRVHIRLDLDKHLPPVLVDSIQIQQIVVNLVNNAQQAMAEQQEDRLIQIQTRTVDDDNEVEVSVSDTGRGISQAEAEQLFDHFSSGNSGGLGVGLKICRSIVESHDGRIWAEDNKSGGATFRFRLPIKNRANLLVTS